MKLFLLDTAFVSEEDAAIVKKLFPKRYERAQRMASPQERLSLIAAGVLLGGVLGLCGHDLLFTPQGRPYAPGRPAFSISHSGGRCVLAVGKGRLGVDIEKLDEGNLLAAPAALTAAELEWISHCPNERFHLLWTRKESVFKAAGGFSDPKDIEAPEGARPFGLNLKSVLFEGFALSVCSDEEIKSIEPEPINEQNHWR